jgi:hypothetical protein
MPLRGIPPRVERSMEMFKILVTDKISDQGMAVFKKEKDFQVDEKLKMSRKTS